MVTLGRPSKYPWQDWFQRLLSGETLKLKRGKHYDCLTRSFVVMFHNEARFRQVRKKKIKISCQVRDGGEGVDVKRADNVRKSNA